MGMPYYSKYKTNRPTKVITIHPEEETNVCTEFNNRPIVDLNQSGGPNDRRAIAITRAMPPAFDC